jgi:hypothetical protein
VTRLARNLWIPLLLLCITVGFSWKLVLSSQYTWLDTGDSMNQVAPWLQVQAAQWHTGHFPLWDTHVQTGQALVGQVQTGTLNPLNWILFSMPLSDGFIQFSSLNWYKVLIQFVGVLFCYLLCRDLRLSPWASVLGGCAFGLGGFIGSIGWPQKMMSALLLPLILMFFLRVLREENVVPNASASGALLGASFLSGHHNIPLFFGLAMLGLWIYYFLAFRGAPSRKLFAAAAFAGCFVLIAAAQIIPARELGKLSLRWVNGPYPVGWDDTVPYSVHNEFSLHPLAIPDIVVPGSRREAFIGIVALTLALLGAATRWQEKMVRLLSAVALAGLLFALGGRSLFHGVLYAVIPGLDKARSPDVAIVIFHLGVVVLAAYGLDSLRSSEVSPLSLRIAVRVLCLSGLFLYASLILLVNLRPPTSDAYTFLSEAGLVALLFAGILLAWSKSRISNRIAGTLVILLLLFELNPVTNYVYQPMEKAGELHRLDDIAAYLKQRPGLPRVDVDEKEISYDFGDWFGVDELRGSQPSALKPFADMQGYPRFPMLLATNYFIGRTPQTPEQISAFEGRSGLHVFIDPSAFPRARMVHDVVSAADDRAVLLAFKNLAIDLRRTVILQGPAPALETCEGGDVDIPRYRPTSVVLRVSSPCRGMLVLADAWFPGWKATVDGKPTEIYRAYNLIRGVVVERGEHEVIMLYRPTSVFLGAGMAVLGMLLCAALQFHRTDVSGRKPSRDLQEALPRTQN